MIGGTQVQVDSDAQTAVQVQRLADLLLARDERLACAESCTGGLIAKLCTDLAGSSAWFERGLVTYSNDAKHELLGVAQSIFTTDGAVSQACVLAMAQGLMQHTPADWGVAVTGVAGPGGGSPGRPVGTVWIGWARRGAAAESRCFRFGGDRDSVRVQTAIASFEGLIERLGTAAGQI